jgi:uncharacterized SAM-binding protein YcdF (DUF218 family)
MYEVLVDVLQPFLLLYLATMLGIANLWRDRQTSRRRLLLITLPFVALTIWCIPAVSYLALGTLEWRYPPLRLRPADAKAIVVLGGSIIPPDAVRRRAELGQSTLFRCRHALEFYRQGEPCPVVLSGGRVTPNRSDPPCARVMRDFMVDSGVRPSDLIEEDRSRSTYENAVECARLLRQRQIRKIILVTEATHMDRALGTLRGQGVDAIPAACNYGTARFDWSVFDFLPSPKAALTCQTVLHEWLGTAWYRLQGRL